MTTVGRGVILSDADNTLWDTDALFATAQLQLLQNTERLIDVEAPVDDDQRLEWLRSYDQAIAALDHRHLRYPPVLLVRSLILGLSGLSPSQAASAVVRGVIPEKLEIHKINAILEEFSTRLSSTPSLLPGVKEGLQRAKQLGLEVWILSEGAAHRQRSRVRVRGLAGLVHGIAEVSKNAEQFARQRRRFAPRPVYVIGDQPDRDIIPAHEAGCRTVLVPSRFKPQWHMKPQCVADRVETTFDRAIEWINHDLSDARF